MTFTKAIFAIILVYGVNWLGVILGLYSRFHWFDVPMHIMGGFGVGMLALAIYNQGIKDIKFKGRFERHLAFWFVPLFVTGFVAIVAILWEIHEFVLDNWFAGAVQIVYRNYTQASLADTMLDLLNGLLGALGSVVVFHRKR